MPSMQIIRLADLSLNYKIQEIMENYGFSSGQYRVLDGYPNELDLSSTHIWPTVTIEVENFFGRDVELGSKQWPALHVVIDVLAKNDAQRDDLSYILWNQLNEKYLTLYDFNDGFPSSVGVYSGIGTLGQYYIEDLTIATVPPPEGLSTDGEKHHAILDGFLYLPNI